MNTFSKKFFKGQEFRLYRMQPCMCVAFVEDRNYMLSIIVFWHYYDNYFSLFFLFVVGVMKLSFIIRFFCAPSFKENPIIFLQVVHRDQQEFYTVILHDMIFSGIPDFLPSIKSALVERINELLSSKLA